MEEDKIVRAAVLKALQEELDDIIESLRGEIKNEVRIQLAPLLRRKVRDCALEELRGMLDDHGGTKYPECGDPSEDGIGPYGSSIQMEKTEAMSSPKVAIGPLAEDPAREGLYLFCLSRGEGANLHGVEGLEGEDVFQLSEDGLTAIVQRCRLEPYGSQDVEQVKIWVEAHQAVIDSAQKLLGTVLPFGFDTIIKPDRMNPATEVLRRWLREEHTSLLGKMDRIEGKKEYGIQIFYAPAKLLENTIRDSQEVRDLKEEIGTQSPGTAFLLKKKIETTARKGMEQQAEDRLQEFMAHIRATVDDIRVEKNKKGDAERTMLLNLSVLVGDDTALKGTLDEIEAQEAFSVRFTGPWPPYSFVS